MIGLPLKNDEEHPLYDYEHEIYDALETGKHVWVKKSRGIGVTEFVLRYLTWKIVSSHKLDSKNVFIVSGTKEEHANELKIRLEKLFDRVYPLLNLKSKYTELWINETKIKVFPSMNVKSMRGYVDVSHIFVDESDFFEPLAQNELEFVIKSYEEKSRGQIVMVSTPNRPDGLFAGIENDDRFGTDFFIKLKLDYKRGLGKIYDDEFIKREMSNDAYFQREYNLKYLGKVGNLLSPTDIDNCITLGERYKDLEPNPYAFHTCGVDPGFGSSHTAIYIGEWDKENNLLRIIHGEDYPPNEATPSHIADILFDIYKKHPHILFYIDGSNRAFINECKTKFGESLNWQKENEVSVQSNKIIPVNFGTEHKKMLSYMHYLITRGMIAIPKSYDKLLISLRTAQHQDWDLDKPNTVNNDHLDALRLACKGIEPK